MIHIALGIPEGHVVRNLLESGLLDALSERGCRTSLVTPAARIESFRARWSGPGIEFIPMQPFEVSGQGKRLAALRRLCIRKGMNRVGEGLRRRERSLHSRRAGKLYSELWKQNLSLVIASHIHLPVEAPLLYGAMDRGISTLGILNSWDNVYKGIACHPDHAVTWNDLNKQELIKFEGYRRDQVTPIGAPAFDPYFGPENQWSREQFCASMALDAGKPILVYATVGQYVRWFEETYLLDKLIEGAQTGVIPTESQIVVRLHPWSKVDLFRKYDREPRVRFSRYENYVPTLDWCPTHREMVVAGNLLRHADVCLTPGSTMALEACIFDTPVVVPLFNEYQPEIWSDYFSRYCTALHFGRLIQESYLPAARNLTEFYQWVNQFLADRSLLRERRRQIVDEYVQFTDGRSIDRLADIAVRRASRQNDCV